MISFVASPQRTCELLILFYSYLFLVLVGTLSVWRISMPFLQLSTELRKDGRPQATIIEIGTLKGLHTHHYKILSY